MNPDLTMPSIRKIDTARDDLFAYEIVGHLNQADADNVFGLLEEAYASHAQIDLLVRITNYEGWDWSVATHQSTLLGKKKGLKHVRRYAVVGGPSWMAALIGLFDPFLSVEMRHFAETDEPAAWAWLDESSGPDDAPIEPA